MEGTHAAAPKRWALTCAHKGICAVLFGAHSLVCLLIMRKRAAPQMNVAQSSVDNKWPLLPGPHWTVLRQSEAKVLVPLHCGGRRVQQTIQQRVIWKHFFVGYWCKNINNQSKKLVLVIKIEACVSLVGCPSIHLSICIGIVWKNPPMWLRRYSGSSSDQKVGGSIPNCPWRLYWQGVSDVW